jgi:WD40 repeat protein
LLLTIRTHGRAVPKSGALDPSGHRFVTVANDRFARVYSLDTGQLLGTLRQNGFVTSVSYSPDGRFIVTSGYEGEARLWNARTLRLARKLFGPKSALTQAVFSPDGKLVAATKNDGTTRVWQVASGFQSAILLGHANQVTRVAFNRFGEALVTGSSDGGVRTWDTNGKPIALLAGHTAAITAVAYSTDGRTVLTASEDGTARLWDPGTEPDLRGLAVERAPTKLALSPDRSRIVVGDGHGFAHVRAVSDGRLLGTIRTPGPVSAVAFGPAGPTAASLPTTSLASSLDGRWSAVGRADGIVVLHNLRRGTQRLLRPNGGPVGALGFSNDGSRLASGTENGSAQIWETRPGRLLHALRRHTRAVTSVAFSPNGLLLVTASLDKDVRLWNAVTGHHRQFLRWHFGPVEGASFSPDGRWIVTAGPSTAAVGLVATGRRVLFLRKHDRPLVGAVFADQDGRLIVTAGRDGRIRTYHCDLCGRVDELIVLAKRRLAARA